MAGIDISSLSVASAQDALRRGDFTSVELTQSVLDAIAAKDGAIGAYLTRRGYVLMRDLKELAEQEGISLTYDLSYQGIHTPVEGEGVGTRYHLPHTNRLTETLPKVWARYDYRLEPAGTV